MSTTAPALPGARKVAILILRLGVEKAGPLLFGLKKHEVAAVIQELATLGVVDPSMGDSVLRDFIDDATGEPPLPIGDPELARHFLQESLDDRTAREILSTIDNTAETVPFQFFDRLDPAVVARNLVEEHPQTVALILSTLNFDYASSILDNLPQPMVSEIGMRLAAIDKVSGEALREVELGMEQRMKPSLENRFLSTSGGVDALVKLMGGLSKELGEGILASLDEYDPDLGAEVRAQMFVFDDLMLLDNRQMQTVLRQIDSNVLPLALKGTGPDLRNKFLDNLSSRAKENLIDEMELLGSVRMADVAEAQTGILDAVRELEATGELVINRGGDDFVT